MNFYTSTEIKDKFGKLLSYLCIDASFSLENVNEIMINSTFLNLFEDDDKIDSFLKKPLEQISEELFHGSANTDVNSNDIGEIYWSGIQYINIFLNYRIPLRLLFLVCPLKKMVGLYEKYHELNEINLWNQVISKLISSESIVKYFRKKENLSIRELSILTNIPEPTIRYYEIDNNNLFIASIKYINALSDVLNIDKIFFQRKSSFVFYCYQLFEDEEFVNVLLSTVSNYFNKNISHLSLYEEEKLINENEYHLVINSSPYIKYHGNKRFMFINMWKQLLSQSIDVYLKSALTNSLAF